MKFNKDDIIILDESSLKEYQDELLNIARDVIEKFDNNGIRYSLSGGSILGAIRHKGFIPWDDDIDLNVPRESYNRLLEVFDKELGDKYYLQTPQKYPELGLMVTQIRKKGTIARRKYDWDIDECGVSIDIYIVENVFDNSIKRSIQKMFSLIFSFAISAIRFYNNRNLPKELLDMEGRKINYSRGKLFCGKFLRVIPLKKWIGWCDFWNSLCKNEKTRLVAIPTGRKHFSGEIYRRDRMLIYKKVQFQTEYFNVPVWAEGYLEHFYGNYMDLPPVEKREKHLFLELKF